MFFKKTPQKSTLILIMLGIGCAIRLGFFFVNGFHLFSDESVYYDLAMSLVHNHVYALSDGIPTAFRPIGYPLFIAAVMTFFSDGNMVIYVQIFLDACSCYFIYRIGARIFSEKTGLIAMMLWTVFPTSIVLCGSVLSETLFTSLLLALIYISVIVERSSYLKMGCIGVVGGILTLIKPQAAVFAFIAMFWVLIRDHSLFQKRIVHLCASLFLMLLTISPWLIRNKLVMGEYVISTNGGINFWIGNNPEAKGSYRIPPNTTLFQIKDEVQRNNEAYKLGFDFIKSHPLGEVKLSVMKCLFLLSSQNYAIMLLRGYEDSSMPAKELLRHSPWWMFAVFNFEFICMMYFGVCGALLLCMKGKIDYKIIAFIIALWCAVHIPYFGQARFIYPILPFVAMFAASMLSRDFPVRESPLPLRIASYVGGLIVVLIPMIEISYYVL